ncbi:hypothetical protein BP00DRAFT_231552 [Aspergillus indologenus CBS 114.80]|uniref:Zn(2)-C6 fungal-type domain-containing protein n=1 Tax=Aspergillus indologenus CBS 114.80 TaxID=1450541 RepID=A0A2V5I328_9EURO|nr:hypothetical protein BP00DRAFT_231552 [Aspergillus indologenus CBS 114.80]
MQPIIPAPSFPSFSPSTRPKVTAACVRKGSAACGECQRQKTICRLRDKAAACERCIEHRLSCAFDTDQDGRRTPASQQSVEDMRAERDTLVELFQALKNSSDANIAPLLDLIRSKASLGDIRLYLENTRSDRQRQSSISSSLGDQSPAVVENSEHAL